MFAVNKATGPTTTGPPVFYNNTFNGIIGFYPSNSSNTQYSFLD